MKAWSQNLVPNGSFECGEDLCNATQITDLGAFSRYACEWTVPTTGTPDIFSKLVADNTCYTHAPGSLSDQSLGSQLPRTGNRFAGLFTYSKGYMLYDTVSYREYLQIKLNKEIEPGQKYCAEMFVSLSENSTYASNGIGMWFNGTATLTGFYYQALYYYPPQVVETNIIKDTQNWTRSYHEFILEEPAQYVTIGNFFGDTNTNAELVKDNNQLRKLAYYYIDDIKVEKRPYDQFVTGGKTVLCKGDVTELTAFAGVDEVLWTTLDDTSTVIHVGKNFSVKPESDATFRVKSTGCYKTVIDTISIKVKPAPELELGPDTLLCKGSTLKLTAGEANSNNAYRWQDDSNARVYNVNNSGNYWVEVSNSFDCKVRDEIKVNFDDVPKVNLGKDTLLCGEFYPLRAGGKEYTYLWSSGSTDSTYLPTKTGTYWVQAENHCGVAKDSIRLYKSSEIFIPNVVTANHDTVNDYFELAAQNEDGSVARIPEISYSLKIFNRWGELVHAQYPYENNWPSDQTIPSGDYFYYADIQGCKTFKGWIQVIR